MEKTSEKALIDALHISATADSLALCHINNLVLLAAFACEARRTLEGIDQVLKYAPAAKELISDRVEAAHNWTQFEDVVGDVLQHVSTQIKALSTVIAQRPFVLNKKSSFG